MANAQNKRVKALYNIKEATQFIEDWRSGKSCKFKPGDVVEGIGDSNRIGVIQFGLAKVGTYQTKWWIGPKAWDVLEGEANENSIKLSTRPNPLKYKYSDMVPGPSSDAIDKLNARIKISDDLRAKNRTGKEVDRYIAVLEEDLNYKKEMKKQEEKDKVVPDEDDDDVPTPIAEIDPVAEKREKIISEE